MRSLSPDSTSTYRSRGTESNFASPVAGITRTSIIVSERVDVPSATLGLRSTPRTSTSSGSPEASSACLDATCLVSCVLALWGGWSLVSAVGSRSRDAARPSVAPSAALWDGARVSFAGALLESPSANNLSNAAGTTPGDPPAFASLADAMPSPPKKAAACAPTPKNRQARTAIAKSRRLRYRARPQRLRFERDRLLLFFKAPAVARAWQANATDRKPTKLTGL